MSPKRKSSAREDASAEPSPTKKTKLVRLSKKESKGGNSVYTSQQKSAIASFTSFTSADRNTAIKHLKAANWDPSTAVNNYFSGGSGSGVSAAAKNNLNKLFDGFREDIPNAPDAVGPDGSMQYFEKLGVDVEGMDVLAVLEIIQAPTMGEMSREGFVEGWSTSNCDTLDKQKAFVNNLKQSLPTNKEKFTQIYKHTFQLGKASNQKAVPLDAALTFWELLFTSPLSAVKWSSPNSPWVAWWKEFLESVWKKSVNRDMWNETLKFAQMTLNDEAMSFWNEESSWPSVIDEFVEWVKKEKRGGANADAMEE